MTVKRYYEQPYLKTLDVRVVHTGEDEAGQYCILNETIFYPEGGGQPADQGEIGDVRVTDVQAIGDEIRHYTERKLQKDEFKASLDWTVRWDHMQQHAGQHLLSAAFDDLLGMKTVSFHLGRERASIDLDVPNLKDADLKTVEENVKNVIRQHLPIRISWTEKEKAMEMNLRKPPAVEGPIRIVSIEGVDMNACGGTHPENTADVELVKIIGAEKVKSGMRVYFLCGDRAFNHFRLLSEAADELVQKLNAPVSQLTEAADALIQEKLKLEKESKQMRSKLLEVEADSLSPTGEKETIQAVFQDRPLKELQQLAKTAMEKYPASALMLVSVEGESIKFVGAKGMEAAGELKTLLHPLLQELDGKGGGNDRLIQGGGKKPASPEALFDIFNAWREK